jgi:ribulose-5-phosphate 4-epimerase/fuculose-1-phosphate aldolase
VAACHTHSPAGKAWSAFARPLEMLNQDACLLYGEAQAVYGVRGCLSCRGGGGWDGGGGGGWGGDGMGTEC